MSPEFILRVLEAIEAGRIFTDLDDADNHMVLVNKNREQRDGLKPEKAQVLKLEAKGLIALDTEISNSRNTRREYMDYLGMRLPVPFVYRYTVTSAGMDFLAEHRKP